MKEKKEDLIWKELNGASPKECYKLVNKLLKIKFKKGRKDK